MNQPIFNGKGRRAALRGMAGMLGALALPAWAARRGEEAALSRLAGVSASADARLMAAALSAQAPGLSSQALVLAVQALENARRESMLKVAPRSLAVIDFSLPSTQKRLWIFDLESKALLFEEWVAHGRKTGDNMAEHFSNIHESHMSSLGAFQAGATYTGRNGYSLRLHGLEPGFNDQAFARAIVIHGAPYVSQNIIRAQGRLGRSWGCPAVRNEVARPLINTLADNAFLFSFYPDRQWLSQSALVGGRVRWLA
ncbi:murein L,D-transpeptidase catalytic domain family protein [Kerstersia similis]|uniref:murein L,D-transpeptidase catalytic domain family protein n=1 Tax=Kerstersia similis TaxID=206505 RepID=UPI0039EEA1D5